MLFSNSLTTEHSFPVIYVIEDNKALNKFICKYLKKVFKKSKIKTFFNIGSFLEFIRNEKELPHIILSDVRLPDGNGLRLKNQLKKLKINLPIIHITAMEGDDVYGQEYTVISKPINLQLLLKLIKKNLKNFFYQQDNNL